MEKGIPHCRLSLVKNLARAGKVRLTASAVAGADLLGFDQAGMLGVVLGLGPAVFCKSLTTYADHRVWQDVYRPVTPAGEVYLKLTVIEDLLIVSFKEA